MIFSRILKAVLNGFATGDSANVADGDTIQEAFGKLQTQSNLAVLQGSNIVLVDKSLSVITGQRYQSIKLANDYVVSQSPGSSHRWVIQVGPGVYTEPPMVLHPYVDIVPVGERFTTKIIPSDVNNPLFTASGMGPMSVQNFAIVGVTNSSAFYNNTATAAVQVSSTQISSCKYGLHCNAGTITADKIGTVSGSAMTNMFRSTGGKIMIDTATVLGTQTFDDYIYNDGGIIHATTVTLLSPNISTGYNSINGGTGGIWVLKQVAGETAIKLAGASLFDGGVLEIDGGLTTHIHIVDSASIIHVMSGNINADKFIFPAGYSAGVMAFIDHKEDDEGYRVLGEFGVGRPEHGDESALGEGDSYSRGLVAYTETSANIFTDVTDQLHSASGSTAALPGTATGNALYLSSDLQSADYLQFYGIKSKVTTAAVVDSGEIIGEYWNGSAWVEFQHMSTEASDRHLPFGRQIFERMGPEQVRFDYNMLASWVKNDPPTTGTNRYWIRFRIDTAITTVPVWEQVKLHTNRTEIEADGWINFFGSARPRGTLPWGMGDLRAWGSSPSDADLFYLNSTDGSDFDIGVGMQENAFAANSRDRMSIGIPLPTDIDTSIPVEVEVYWMGNSDTAGDVVWKTSMGIAPLGSSIDTSVAAAPTSINCGKIQTITESVGAGMAGVLVRTVFEFDLCDAIPMHTDGSSDVFIASIASSGDDANDNYPGTRYVSGLRATYARWNNGGHR